MPTIDDSKALVDVRNPTIYTSNQVITYGFLNNLTVADYQQFSATDPGVIAIKNAANFIQFSAEQRTAVDVITKALEKMVGVRFRLATVGETPMIRFGNTAFADFGGVNARSPSGATNYVNDIFVNRIYAENGQ